MTGGGSGGGGGSLEMSMMEANHAKVRSMAGYFLTTLRVSPRVLATNHHRPSFTLSPGGAGIAVKTENR